MKNSDPPGWDNFFTPGLILVEIHQMKLQTKFESARPYGFGQEDY